MATRGRKPTPTALKVLEGNPGKRKLNDNEPRPEKKAPSCPKWLEPEAFARWKEAEEFITQHGTIVKTPSGYWQQVPQVSIAQTYLKIMNRLAEQFGLTPSSRSRIIADSTGNRNEDEMEALLGGDG